MAVGHQYPDVVLTAIPLTLVAAYGVGTLLEARLIVAMAAVGICYFLMADGLFWHAPEE